MTASAAGSTTSTPSGTSSEMGSNVTVAPSGPPVTGLGETGLVGGDVEGAPEPVGAVLALLAPDLLGTEERHVADVVGGVGRVGIGSLREVDVHGVHDAVGLRDVDVLDVEVQVTALPPAEGVVALGARPPVDGHLDAGRRAGQLHLVVARPEELGRRGVGVREGVHADGLRSGQVGQRGDLVGVAQLGDGVDDVGGGERGEGAALVVEREGLGQPRRADGLARPPPCPSHTDHRRSTLRVVQPEDRVEGGPVGSSPSTRRSATCDVVVRGGLEVAPPAEEVARRRHRAAEPGRRRRGVGPSRPSPPTGRDRRRQAGPGVDRRRCGLATNNGLGVPSGRVGRRNAGGRAFVPPPAS